MPKMTLLFAAIGLVSSAIASTLWFALLYIVMNFSWSIIYLYGPTLFLALLASFISYAMFRAALLGGADNETDE